MDPITLIVSAVVAGAALAAKDVAVQAVKDGYAGLKKLIVGKFGGGAQAAVEQLEQQAKAPKTPENEQVKQAWESALKATLTAAHAESDQELVKQAQSFMDLLKQHGLGDRTTYSATVTGSGAIAQGPGATAAGERGVAIGGSVTGGTIITGDNNVVGDKPENKP